MEQQPFDRCEPDASATVAVVITTFDDFEFLQDAVSSVLQQQRAADEIIVVDDGSLVSPAPFLAGFPRIRLLRKQNGGLSSARNHGLRAVSSRFVAFLDADDRYEPHALATGINCFSSFPNAAMVYGGHRRIDTQGRAIGRDHYQASGPDPYEDLLRVNFIGMHATVLYRTEILTEVGGFDETLSSCEDYDVYLRLTQKYSIASHPDIIAEYRRHERNMSSDNARMLRSVLQVHQRHYSTRQGHRQAWHAGQQLWSVCYKAESPFVRNREGVGGAVQDFFRRIARSVARRTQRRFRHGRLHRLLFRIIPSWPPPPGLVDFGSFSGTKPVSSNFGYDRGTPIDRYYIERFLLEHSVDIAGHVLEVGEDTYSRRFGRQRITKQDVLHYNLADEGVTIVGDLTQAGVLPESTFDCVVLTQVLQWVLDLEQAVERLYKALKPGGVLLMTVPGIGQIEQTEYHQKWLWSFTEDSVRALFGRRFDASALEIRTCGNVFAATACLQGLALEEVDQTKLDEADLIFPVVVTLRARRLP